MVCYLYGRDKNILVKPVLFTDNLKFVSYFIQSIYDSCVSLHRYCQGGVHAGREGDVDQGHQGGDHLQDWIVLR